MTSEYHNECTIYVNIHYYVLYINLGTCVLYILTNFKIINGDINMYGIKIAIKLKNIKKGIIKCVLIFFEAL
jgi:hypothetical protein